MKIKRQRGKSARGVKTASLDITGMGGTKARVEEPNGVKPVHYGVEKKEETPQNKEKQIWEKNPEDERCQSHRKKENREKKCRVRGYDSGKKSRGRGGKKAQAKKKTKVGCPLAERRGEKGDGAGSSISSRKGRKGFGQRGCNDGAARHGFWARWRGGRGVLGLSCLSSRGEGGKKKGSLGTQRSRTAKHNWVGDMFARIGEKIVSQKKKTCNPFRKLSRA